MIKTITVFPVSAKTLRLHRRLDPPRVRIDDLLFVSVLILGACTAIAVLLLGGE